MWGQASLSLPWLGVIEQAAQKNSYDDLISSSIMLMIRALQACNEFCTQQKQRINLFNQKIKKVQKTWYVDDNKLLWYNNALFILDDIATRVKLFQHYHDDFMAEHFEVEKTHNFLRKKFFWQNIQKDIQKYIGFYDIYQKIKMSYYHFYNFFALLPVPDELWQEITMDFIVGLPPSKHKGNVYDSILMVMNQYTKMVWYLSINAIIKSHKLDDLLMEKVFLYGPGASMSIVSDRGSVFTSDYWSELYYHMKIKQQLSTAFHSQTDDQMEQQN